MTQETETETDYKAIEQQITELFKQLSPGAQSNVLDVLIGIADLEEEDGDTHPFNTLAHLAEIDDGIGYSQHTRDPMIGGLSADD